MYAEAPGEVEGVEAGDDPDGYEYRERRVCGRDVVREARFDCGEEEELKECEESEDTVLTKVGAAKCVHRCDGIEQAEGGGRDEQNAEVVPPGRDVAFNLAGGSVQDVEADVLVDEDRAEAVIEL